MSGSTTVSQAATSIKALNMMVGTNAFPFAKVVAGETQQLGSNGSVTLQLFDAMSNPIGVKGRSLSSVSLYTTGDGDSIDVTKSSTIDENAGKITINLKSDMEKLTHGAFNVRISLKDSKKKTVTIHSAENVKIQTAVAFTNFSHKISTHKDDPAVLTKYPNKAANLEK